MHVRRDWTIAEVIFSWRVESNQLERALGCAYDHGTSKLRHAKKRHPCRRSPDNKNQNKKLNAPKKKKKDKIQTKSG